MAYMVLQICDNFKLRTVTFYSDAICGGQCMSCTLLMFVLLVRQLQHPVYYQNLCPLLPPHHLISRLTSHLSSSHCTVESNYLWVFLKMTLQVCFYIRHVHTCTCTCTMQQGTYTTSVRVYLLHVHVHVQCV